jgi:hypothetical protein
VDRVPPSAFLDREQAPVLPDSVTIGHAGDVIGDGARAVALVLLLKLRRKQARLLVEGLKQLADDAAGLGCGAVDALVTVQVG